MSYICEIVFASFNLYHYPANLISSSNTPIDTSVQPTTAIIAQTIIPYPTFFKGGNIEIKNPATAITGPVIKSVLERLCCVLVASVSSCAIAINKLCITAPLSYIKKDFFNEKARTNTKSHFI